MAHRATFVAFDGFFLFWGRRGVVVVELGRLKKEIDKATKLTGRFSLC